MKKLLFFYVFIFILNVFASAGEINVGDHTINEYFYFQPKYSSGPAITDSFTISRARIDLWGNIGEKSAYFIEIDAASSQPLVYSWADLLFDANNKITIGRIYYPFSLEYSTPPCKFDTINPTSMLWAYFGYSRDIGIQWSSKYDLYKYYIAVVNGRDWEMTDNNDTKDIVGRCVLYPVKDLGIGISYYNGKSGTTEADKILGGGEVSYIAGDFSFKGELYAGKNSGIETRGWYVQPSYYVLPGIQTLIKYEEWDSDLSVAGNGNIITTLGVNWFYDKTTKLQINYISNKEETAETDNDQLLMQLQLSF